MKVHVLNDADLMQCEALPASGVPTALQGTMCLWNIRSLYELQPEIVTRGTRCEQPVQRVHHHTGSALPRCMT